ncbi:site-specific integrase [Neorhizobium sp. JUb45]|uniref:tyrosine-type recombinase/integrase n=1 Tax=Neorhizobium sp. JUb45 TaxID=2485113 RepID=UPI00104656F6|nr:site-specific integrase [Neorhizobium sp. JUb45]TCR01044.1 phage integrase family protein [Neorhizobium sp. JUb45]
MNMTFRTTPPATENRIARSFAETAKSYMEHGGERKYLQNILPHLGDRLLTEIFPFDVRQLADELYPTQTNATKNRCVVTPVRAVVYHGYDRGWGPSTRIKNFKQERPRRKKAASQAWLDAFARQCGKDRLPHLAALILFMSQTGARVSEAVALKWREVDLAGRTVLLVKTKTDQNSIRFLTDQLISRLYELSRDADPDELVFRYKNRHSVNERISAVCKRSGISYKPSHTCGRHAFANNTLAMGVDVKSVMDAGGWRSAAVFLGTYANPRNAGRIVADKHNLYQYDNEL